MTARVAKSVLNTVNRNGAVPVPLAPPLDWFKPPADMAQRAASGIPTGLNVILDGADAGRVYGHVAPKNQCILDGRPGCWTVPEGDTLGFSMQGFTEVASGETIETGVIPMDINHAPMHLDPDGAVDFMANTQAQFARVVYGWDEIGIWACGALSPGVTWSDAVRVRAAAQSGDWRAMLSEITFDDGRPPELRFLGSIAVNLPGFPLAMQVARRSSFRRFPAAIIFTTKEATVPETQTLARTAGSIFSLKPKEMFEEDDEVMFGAGRRGRVLGMAVDAAGADCVTVQELFDDGTLGDCEEPVMVAAAECVPTGREFDWETSTDYPEAMMEDPDIAVVAAAPCSCQQATEADQLSDELAVTAASATPAVPNVPDPTPDILLERLDAAEKSITALNERIDMMDAAMAVKAEASAIAAALGADTLD